VPGVSTGQQYAGTNITVTYTSASQIDLAGADSGANYLTVIAAVRYANVSSAAATTVGDRTVSVTVNDGTVDSSAAIATVTVKQAPVVDLDGDDSSGATGSDYQGVFIEAGGGVAIADTDASLVDDQPNLNQMRVTLTNAQGDAGEGIGIPGVTSGGTYGATAITVTYDSADQITLSGSDTHANYLLALKAVRYDNASATPNATARVITVTGTDSNNDTGGAASATLTVTPVNNTPVVAINAGFTVAEGGSHILVNSELQVTDADSSAAQLTYTVTVLPAHGSLERNSVALASNGTFTQSELDSGLIGYRHDNGESTADSFVFTVSDGAGGAIGATTFNITITPANDIPVINDLAGDALAYTAGSAALVVDQGTAATVADPDSADFATGALTVAIVSGGVAAEDLLGVRHQGSGAGQIGVSGNQISYGGAVIGSYAGGTGGADLAVTFNANASPAALGALLRNITYGNALGAVTSGARGLRFVVTDGDGGTSASVDASVVVGTLPVIYTGALPGGGTATATVAGGGAGCGFTKSVFIRVSGDAGSPAVPPPSGYSFPVGLFDFSLDNCTPGATVTVTITYTTELAANTEYWKFGPTPTPSLDPVRDPTPGPTPHWYRIPATVVGGNTIVFQITDGLLGDDNGASDGIIIDQGGPATPAPQSIPTLSQWGMLLLSGLLGWFGLGRLNGPKSRSGGC
jgi:VCBS repeat-containing protein